MAQVTRVPQAFPPLLDEAQWSAFVDQHSLTPREAEVAMLITSGYGYEGICERLGVCRPTLRTHLRSAYQKVGVQSRVELILHIVHTNLSNGEPR